MRTIEERVAVRFAKTFPTQEALKQYLQEHPGADRSKHKVVETAYRQTSKEAVANAQKLAKHTRWKRPTLEEEGVEVKRTAKDLGISLKKIMRAWDEAKIEPLDEEDWSRLENTDSYDTDTFEKADAKAQEYDRDLSWTVARMGKTLPSPIILFRKGKPPYLVGGNTRLMASRALGAKPSVLALRID